jgi:hypothetical protein
MASGDQLKALLRSYLEGNEAQFYSVAMQLAANEARKGHGRLAEELRELIDQTKVARKRAALEPPTPITRPRGELAQLLRVTYPKARLADLIEVISGAGVQNLHVPASPHVRGVSV